MAVTRDEIVAVFEGWGERIHQLDPPRLPLSLRGSDAEQVLTTIGLPSGLANVLTFKVTQDHPLVTVADFYRRRAADDDDALIVFGMANLDLLCVDVASGVVFSQSERRRRQKVATSMGAFVEILSIVARELLRLCDEGADRTGRGLKMARRDLADRLRQVDPGGGAEAWAAWSLVFGDLLAEVEIFPECPDPDDVEVSLAWSDGALHLETTLYCTDEAEADSLRRRFGRTTSLIEEITSAETRAAALELVQQVGGAPPGHGSVVMVVDNAAKSADPVERESVIPTVVFLGWPELETVLNALLGSESDPAVRATATRARELIDAG